MTSSVLFFFHVEKLILAELQLTIFEQKILKLYDFYQTLFRDKLSLSEESIQIFLKVSLPKLNDNQALECEGVINENEVLKALTSMDNYKTPRMTVL